jgi:hypothetical protein
MRTQITGWVKFIAMLWPLMQFVMRLVFLVLFRHPLRQILERFDCSDVSRIKIWPLEVEKQSRSRRARTPRRTRRRSARQ